MTASLPDSEMRELPRWLWLWFPPLMVVYLVVVKITGPERLLHGERSAIELGTIVVLLVAIVAGVLVFRRRHRLPTKHLRIWCGLLTLGCVHFAGEEASWGQHIFGWRTPDGLATLNEQAETNIHNIDGIFDQLPRTTLNLMVAIGGLAMPLLRRRRTGDWRPRSGAWGLLLPTVVCLPTAILACTIGLPGRFIHWFGGTVPPALNYSGGEFKEYYFGLFLMLYLLSILRRLPADDALPK